MRHQQVVVDYVVMLKTSITCLLLAASGWILFRLIQAIFVFPKYLQQQDELAKENEEPLIDDNKPDEVDKQTEDDVLPKDDEAPPPPPLEEKKLN